MGIIECGCGRENDNAQGEAECIIISRDHNAFNNIRSIRA